MTIFLKCLLCSAWLLLAGLSPLRAQDSEDEVDAASAEVEESDEAYRRRMELEDARQRDLGYTLPAPTYAQKQEKLDKLPEESRDNIRDQLVDIIVQNGEWEPSDALKEFPYEPTAAARGNPELKQQEQEAWDEQIEKYHKREAAAFGTYLGPVPGPGNPTGEEGGGQEGDGGEGMDTGSKQQGGGSGEQAGDQSGGQDEVAGTAGTYEPYQSNRSTSEEEVSTAGVQQSALDFIKGLQGKAQPPAAQPAAQAQAEASASADAQANPAASAESRQATAEPQSAAESSENTNDTADESEQKESADHTVEIDLTTPGIIRIDELDKLQGTDRPAGSEGARQP